MKIAFDENAPAAMVRVFRSLAQERAFKNKVGEFTFVHARDYAPDKTDSDYKYRDDTPWLKRFSKDNGKIVVSVDARMRQSPHECLALQQLGFITIFFEKKWSGWDFFSKSALILRWWPRIAQKVKTAKPGTMWCVPNDWRDGENLRAINPVTTKISHQPPQRKKITRKAEKSKNLPREESQISFKFNEKDSEIPHQSK